MEEGSELRSGSLSKTGGSWRVLRTNWKDYLDLFDLKPYGRFLFVGGTFLATWFDSNSKKKACIALFFLTMKTQNKRSNFRRAPLSHDNQTLSKDNVDFSCRQREALRVRCTKGPEKEA